MAYYRTPSKRIRSLSDGPAMLATLAVSLLCWCIGFYFSIGVPVAENAGSSPAWLAASLLLRNKVVAYASGLFLAVLAASVVQRICDSEMLIHELTHLPFMFFIIFISANVGLLPISEAAVAMLCSAASIHALFGSYKNPEATGKLFNAAFFAGAASLFVPQMIWFAPLLWAGMYQLRSMSLKSFAASLAGLLTVYWFVLAGCVLAKDFTMLEAFRSETADFDFLSLGALLHYHQIEVAGIILLVAAVYFRIRTDAVNSVKVCSMLSFLFYMAVWALALIVIYGDDSDSFFAVLYLPLSVLAAYFFENLRLRFRFISYYAVLIALAANFMLRVWNS